MSFPELTNDLFLRAARGEETERAPVWVMRQAGRYLPEFRETRLKHDFFEICRTPELACEVTLQPIRRYAGLVDAAIIFSDILVVPQALGMTVLMDPGHGPVLPEPLIDPSHLSRLPSHVDVSKELGYVMHAITLTRQRLEGKVPLIGFSGAPWTLMAYMVEGGGSKTWQKAKTWLFKYPEASHELLQKITDVIIDYLFAQIQAGAQAIQLFDSWASDLSPNHFAQYALPYYIKIASGIREKLSASAVPAVPFILFAKGANHAFQALAQSGWDVLGLDWVAPPVEVRRLVGNRVALQGNADPNILYGGKEAIEKEVKRIAGEFAVGGRSKGHIFNLGHGITPGVDPDDLKFFFECVHKYTASSK